MERLAVSIRSGNSPHTDATTVGSLLYEEMGIPKWRMW
jgi:hypothetical protein